MEEVLQHLQSIIEENIKLLAAPTAEIAGYQNWGIQRRTLFDRLENFQVSSDDATATIHLIQEIVKLDAEILFRMEQNLAVLGEKLITASKLRQSINGSSVHRSRFMRRIV